jgi:hypothetical protein
MDKHHGTRIIRDNGMEDYESIQTDWYEADEVVELARRALKFLDYASHDWNCDIQKWGILGSKCTCEMEGLLAELEQIVKEGEG